MKYQVRWAEPVLQELAAIWLQADSAPRSLLIAATNDLDRHLAEDPLAFGESRGAGRRIGISRPLVVVFRIDFSRDLVSVIHCYLTH